MNTRERVLKEALNCVNGEREKQYGNPEDNFKRIADLWSVYLTSIFEDVVFELNPIDVAKMMVLFKIARSNGDKDKMDNYLDMIGYSACAAEILEKETEMSPDCESKMAESRSCSKKAFDNIRDTFEQVAPGTVTNKEEFEKCDAGMRAYQSYSYFHDKLANYVEIKAKEEHIPLENLKDIDRKFPRELSDYLDQASKDCAINGKRLFDCYKEIDALFEKYKEVTTIGRLWDKKKCGSFWDAYNSISAYIFSSSDLAKVNQLDVVECLIKNKHAPTEMAALIMDSKLGFDDFFAFVDDAINELKKDKK